MKLVDELKHWSAGVRLYIALGTALFTIESVWWAETAYGGSLLFATRLEELYAWTGLALLALALLIGPVCGIWSAIPGRRLLQDARRLLGVGAAWFVVLHIAISYASLFKFANPLSLPGTYQRAFLAGIVAALILLAMAFTSFNKAFRAMGKWWFRLHRLVYLVVILGLLHAFLIGSHATHLPELGILTAVVLLALGLHIYQVYRQSKAASVWQLVTLPSIAILLLASLFFGYSQHKKANHVMSPTGMDHMEMHQ